MKKQYIKPTAVKVAVKGTLMHTGSIQNTTGDVQTGVQENNNGDFEAGSKDHSTRIVKDINGNILEGIGVTPDIEMSYAQGTFKDGEDSWLSRAVDYIKTGK